MPDDKKTYGGVPLRYKELEVLRLAAAGLRNKEVADTVNLALPTIEKMLGNTGPLSIYHKIGVTSRAEAAAWYQANVVSRSEIAAEGQEALPSQEIIVGSEEIDNEDPETELVTPDTTALVVMYVCITIFFFIPLALSGLRSGLFNFYANIYMLVPLTGGALGLRRIRRVKPNKTNTARRVIIFFSCALILWGVGNLIWTYGNYIGYNVPYPWWSDASYSVSQIFLVIGALYFLAKVAEIPIRIRTIILSTMVALYVIAPLVLWTRGWWLSNEDDPLKFIADIFYPGCDALAASAMVLAIRHPSFVLTRPRMKLAVQIIFIGLLVQFIADLSFSVFTNFPEENPYSYYNGNWMDWLFTTAFLLNSLGLQYFPLQKEKGQ